MLVAGAIVEVEGSSLIPDIVVTPEPLDLSKPRVDKPIIIVEVLSPSGEKDDLSRKLMPYIKIPTLRHYLAVAQDALRIIHHERPAGQEARSSPPSAAATCCTSSHRASIFRRPDLRRPAGVRRPR
jgi:Uma2 family endonuclease